VRVIRACPKSPFHHFCGRYFRPSLSAPPNFYSFSTVQTTLCNGTYEGKNFADVIKKELIGVNVEIAKRSDYD